MTQTPTLHGWFFDHSETGAVIWTQGEKHFFPTLSQAAEFAERNPR